MIWLEHITREDVTCRHNHIRCWYSPPDRLIVHTQEQRVTSLASKSCPLCPRYHNDTFSRQLPYNDTSAHRQNTKTVNRYTDVCIMYVWMHLIYTQTCVHTHSHTHTQIHTHTLTRTHLHACTRPRTHAHTDHENNTGNTINRKAWIITKDR